MGNSGEKLTKELILLLLEELDSRLGANNLKVRMNIYGGAVMCLVFNARKITKDVDAIFDNTKKVYMESYAMATKYGISSDWLNDSIRIIEDKFKKETLLKVGTYSNIELYVPSAEQMLAMKLYAARAKPYKDEDDVEFLIQHLKLKKKKEVQSILFKYFDKKIIDEKTSLLVNKMADRLDLE